VTVNWPDADPSGTVWFGHFCRYLEETEEEMFRSLGWDRQAVIDELNIFMPRTRFEVVFSAPAKPSDPLRIGIAVNWPTDRRIEYAFAIEQKASGVLVCEGKYRVACVSSSTFETRAFPEELVTLLAPYTTGRESV
jgi:4-hydroxybenzoyl-CoA thioesterase